MDVSDTPSTYLQPQVAMLTKPLPSLGPAYMPDKQTRLRGLCPSWGSLWKARQGSGRGLGSFAAGWVGRVELPLFRQVEHGERGRKAVRADTRETKRDEAAGQVRALWKLGHRKLSNSRPPACDGGLCIIHLCLRGAHYYIVTSGQRRDWKTLTIPVCEVTSALPGCWGSMYRSRVIGDILPVLLQPWWDYNSQQGTDNQGMLALVVSHPYCGAA